MISYICNRKRPQCTHPSCQAKALYGYEMCTHTTDLVYAKNWDHEPSEEELESYFDCYGKKTLDPDWIERSRDD